MNQEVREQAIRRILVALDTSPSSLAALEAAAELATSFGAELVGLFVEDINLVRLAELSFTHEVGLFSATSRRLEIRYVERQFRGRASRAHRQLARIAEKAKVNWSFRVARGAIAAELLAAASDADLVILGKAGWSPLARKRLGSTTRAILSQGSQPILVLQPGVGLGLPLLVVYDGSEAARRALAATGLLMQGKRGHVTVLILADGPEAAQQLQQEASALVEDQELKTRYLWQTGTSAWKLARALQREGCRMLVLPGDGSRLDRETILALLDEVECPVLLVR